MSRSQEIYSQDDIFNWTGPDTYQEIVGPLESDDIDKVLKSYRFSHGIPEVMRGSVELNFIEENPVLEQNQ